MTQTVETEAGKDFHTLPAVEHGYERGTTYLEPVSSREVSFVSGNKHGLRFFRSLVFRSADGRAPTPQECLSAIPSDIVSEVCAVRDPATVHPTPCKEGTIYVIDLFRKVDSDLVS